MRRRLALPLRLALARRRSPRWWRTQAAGTRAGRDGDRLGDQDARARAGPAAVTTPSVTSPPSSQPATAETFAYPADGSIVSRQPRRRRASSTDGRAERIGERPRATSPALSLFGGEITADAVTGACVGRHGPSGAGGNKNGSSVTNLVVDGQPVTGHRTPRSATGGSCRSTRRASTESRPRQARGLPRDVRHRARRAADRRPRRSARRQRDPDRLRRGCGADRAARATHDDADDHHHRRPAPRADVDPSAGTRRASGPKRTAAQTQGRCTLHPKLTAGHYVFPVYGPSSYIDTFGAAALGRHLPPRRRHLRRSSASRSSRSRTARSSRSAGTSSAATGSGSSTGRGTSSTTRTSRRSRPPRRTAPT